MMLKDLETWEEEDEDIDLQLHLVLKTAKWSDRIRAMNYKSVCIKVRSELQILQPKLGQKSSKWMISDNFKVSCLKIFSLLFVRKIASNFASFGITRQFTKKQLRCPLTKMNGEVRTGGKLTVENTLHFPVESETHQLDFARPVHHYMIIAVFSL